MQIAKLTVLLCTMLLFSCNSERDLIENGGSIFESDGYYHLRIGVGLDKDPESRAATPSGKENLVIEDVVLFTVDTVSVNKVVVDTALMTAVGDNAYQCKIPSKIDLSKVGFYAVANTKANFASLSDIEGKSFDDLLNQKLLVDHSGISSGDGNYKTALMNRYAAKYDALTKSISSITLARTPARIFLDCSSLAYAVQRITFTNLANQTTLRTICSGSGNSDPADLITMEDEKTGISGNGNSFYYLVYPSDKSVDVTITANDQTLTRTIGVMKPGKSYRMNINYLDISLEGLGADTKMMKDDELKVKLSVKPDVSSITRVVEWESSNESVLTVSVPTDASWKEATLKGVAKGTATLTARCQGVVVSCEVTVEEPVSRVIHMVELDNSWNYVRLENGVHSTISLGLSGGHNINWMQLVGSDFYISTTDGLFEISNNSLSNKKLTDIPLVIKGKNVLCYDTYITSLKVKDLSNKELYNYEIPKVISESNVQSNSLISFCWDSSENLYLGIGFRTTSGRYLNCIWRYEEGQNPFLSSALLMVEASSPISGMKWYNGNFYWVINSGSALQYWKEGQVICADYTFNSSYESWSNDFVVLNGNIYVAGDVSGYDGTGNRYLYIGAIEGNQWNRSKKVYQDKDSSRGFIFSKDEVLYILQAKYFTGGRESYLYKGLDDTEPFYLGAKEVFAFIVE